MSRKRDKELDVPVLLLATNLDFETDEAAGKFHEFQKHLKQNRREQEFNRKAVIEKTMLHARGEAEDYERLMLYVKAMGIKNVLGAIEGGKNGGRGKMDEMDIGKIAERILSALSRAGVQINEEERAAVAREITEEESESLDNLI